MRNIIKIYTEPAFLICTVLLALSAGGMTIATKKLGIYLQKEPLPLKKSLDLLDQNGLSPYRVVNKTKITNSEVIKTLGTDQYIQWVLQDPEEPLNSDVRNCSLFITYYDLPCNVPHTPEECYVGGGNERLSGGSLTLSVDKNETVQTIECRHLVFLNSSERGWQLDTKFSVNYLLNANGTYLGNRTAARKTLNKNIFGKSSYFSKVEWNFMTGSGLRTNPPKEKLIEASEKLLSVILPVLETQHWPDWKTNN